VIIPYLRGFGPTSFLEDQTCRSGQQAALAHDLRDLIIGLDLDRPLVFGYDWGGCAASALWPEMVSGLATVSGYSIQDIASSQRPRPPSAERRLWYQYYLHSERGRRGLDRHRDEFTRQLWSEWSPTWAFDNVDGARKLVGFGA
jgi:pimeloyl-ACP methyl ester carboxylesterase